MLHDRVKQVGSLNAHIADWLQVSVMLPAEKMSRKLVGGGADGYHDRNEGGSRNNIRLD